MTQPTPFSTNNIDELYASKTQAAKFSELLVETRLLNPDEVTEGDVIRILEALWGVDDPENLIEEFGLKRVVRCHNIILRIARKGRLKALSNPAGYFRNSLRGRRSQNKRQKYL